MKASQTIISGLLLVLSLCCHQTEKTVAFVLPFSGSSNAANRLSFLSKAKCTVHSSSSTTQKHSSSFYDMEDDDDEDDEDDFIDFDSLGDWRDFRRNLARTIPTFEEGTESTKPVVKISSVSKENEEVLSSQNEELAEEYIKGVWAHEVATPESGGLIVRMPLEVELYRNHRHSIVGRKLHKKYGDAVDRDDATLWYKKAQALIEDEMSEIASTADESGQIDATKLSDESTEMLQLYLDNQETWQEVCLVVERDDVAGTAKTLVLNRPMALKLTENLSRLVLYGAYQSSTGTGDSEKKIKVDLAKFMLAFGNECAVYVGGTDRQDEPATLIHGIKDLKGAREISPGSGIYEGGLEAAVQGVLYGKYKPLDFRFFVGSHTYNESKLDVAVVLGKYQPVACARSLALKQCISLPKPLWHEVLELCGGDMTEVSDLEMLKRDDLLFQLVDDDDDENIMDELGILDDEDDDYYED